MKYPENHCKDIFESFLSFKLTLPMNDKYYVIIDESNINFSKKDNDNINLNSGIFQNIFCNSLFYKINKNFKERRNYLFKRR